MLSHHIDKKVDRLEQLFSYAKNAKTSKECYEILCSLYYLDKNTIKAKYYHAFTNLVLHSLDHFNDIKHIHTLIRSVITIDSEEYKKISAAYEEILASAWNNIKAKTADLTKKERFEFFIENMSMFKHYDSVMRVLSEKLIPEQDFLQFLIMANRFCELSSHQNEIANYLSPQDQKHLKQHHKEHPRSNKADILMIAARNAKSEDERYKIIKLNIMYDYDATMQAIKHQYYDEYTTLLYRILGKISSTDYVIQAMADVIETDSFDKKRLLEHYNLMQEFNWSEIQEKTANLTKRQRFEFLIKNQQLINSYEIVSKVISNKLIPENTYLQFLLMACKRGALAAYDADDFNIYLSVENQLVLHRVRNKPKEETLIPVTTEQGGKVFLSGHPSNFLTVSHAKEDGSIHSFRSVYHGDYISVHGNHVIQQGFTTRDKTNKILNTLIVCHNLTSGKSTRPTKISYSHAYPVTVNNDGNYLFMLSYPSTYDKNIHKFNYSLELSVFGLNHKNHFVPITNLDLPNNYHPQGGKLKFSDDEKKLVVVSGNIKFVLDVSNMKAPKIASVKEVDGTFSALLPDNRIVLFNHNENYVTIMPLLGDKNSKETIKLKLTDKHLFIQECIASNDGKYLVIYMDHDYFYDVMQNIPRRIDLWDISDTNNIKLVESKNLDDHYRFNDYYITNDGKIMFNDGFIMEMETLTKAYKQPQKAPAKSEEKHNNPPKDVKHEFTKAPSMIERKKTPQLVYSRGPSFFSNPVGWLAHNTPGFEAMIDYAVSSAAKLK